MVASEGDLLDIIAKESLTDKSRLVRSARLDDLGIQSIDMISILFAIEEKYGTQFDEGNFPTVETLGEMLDFMLLKISEEGTGAQAV